MGTAQTPAAQSRPSAILSKTAGSGVAGLRLKQVRWPTKYWLSTLPAAPSLQSLVKMAKRRWIVERDYEKLKQELHTLRSCAPTEPPSTSLLRCLTLAINSIPEDGG
jgi:SRSO17 transposase